MRVLIVDPHPAFRSVSSALLDAEGLEVAGARGWEGAVEAAASLRPDVALVDVSPYRPEGLRVVRSLASLPAPPATVLMSAARPEEILAASLGASGFLGKAGLSAGAIAEAAAVTLSA